MHTNVIRAYIALMLLVSISQNFSSNSHVSVKFKLSCTVPHKNALGWIYHFP